MCGTAMVAEWDGGGPNSSLTYAPHSAAPVFDGVNADVAIRQRHERWPDEERARITAEASPRG